MLVGCMLRNRQEYILCIVFCKGVLHFFFLKHYLTYLYTYFISRGEISLKHTAQTSKTDHTIITPK